MNTQTKLEEMRKRCEAATPEPWKAIHGDSYCAYPSVLRANGPHFILLDASEEEAAKAADDVRFPGMNADATFIAHARTDLPVCIAALEVALKALDQWEVQDADGNFPDERTYYERTLSPIARKALRDIEGLLT